MKLNQLLKFALFSIACLAIGGGAGCNLCRDEVLEKIASPDGKWTATSLTRDCGATASEYMGVNLQDVKQKQLESKNEVFVVKHIHRLHVSWQGTDSLVIECENCTGDDVKKKLERLGRVQIIYR